MMKTIKNILPLLLLFILPIVYSQEHVPETNQKWEDLKHTWKAFWISHPNTALSEYGVFHFRKTFVLETNAEEFIIHVSADNRYRLYVNGTEVCEGPARGDLMNWRYESVDISPYLEPGANTIAALVYNLGEHRPPVQFSRRTAFILQADSEKYDLVNTNNTWKVMKNAAYHPISISSERVHGFYVVGPCDSIVGKQYQWGWENPGYEDAAWLQASGSVLDRGVGRGFIHGADWHLVPRNIPAMEKSKELIPEIERAEGIHPHDGFLTGERALTIKKDSRISILLDRTHLTIGYPQLTVSGGKGSHIKVEYAEALYDASGSKGIRNQVEGKEISGAYDVFMPDGGDKRLFTPLWLRTFRYVQIDIETRDEALIIHDFHNVFTAYPFQENARISIEPDTFGIQKIWDTGWRTARLCAGETYFDCPYYEQLQYVGDTRIQALISLYISGDDRLMRNAIQQFNNSIIPEGLTLCRAPTHVGQVIPTFSLYWIAMVHDYHMHRDDPDFVKQFLPGIRSVLAWYESRIDDTNMLGPLDWWNFADWANGFPNGIPAGADNGNSALISLSYAYALAYASELFAHFDLDFESESYASLAQSIKRAVYGNCFDDTRQIFADTPDKKEYSQHTNVMAILTDAIPEDEQAGLFERIVSDSSLIQTSLYFKFYQMRALVHAGLGNRYLELLDPWNDMIDLGLSTFPETEPGSKSMVSSRSDCHAWSASPCYDLIATVCGIMPALPGFSSVSIKPHLGPSQKASCKMPHPWGTITVELERRGSSGLDGTVSLPRGITGEFQWNETTIRLSGGTQTINLPSINTDADESAWKKIIETYVH